ncbi:hypothetical protein WHI96_08000 [Pseudonocardia tropica]|uniref:Terminase large subunit gp17-like C-terminal domain-containing protein n=1 Tax=Pseudonocardia tropica TaxID=681289 RepID=A0ABV1JS65_9PSEU
MPGSQSPFAGPERFELSRLLGSVNPRLLETSEGRRVLTAYDPLIWALLYFPHHLKSAETGEVISFSDFHLDICERAKLWAKKELGPAEVREADVAPRGSGKSTWKFLILPTWALAHGHRRYVSAFSDSASQAEQHLTTVKTELDNNAVLREDYPELCAPALRPTGTKVADHRSMYVSRSGAVFTAKGIDSSVLGAKVGSQRPDLLLFDDIEPSGGNYSAYQKEQRLSTILDAILPMNDRAVVQVVGTTVMPGSIIDDLVKSLTLSEDQIADWVRDERFRAFSYPAITTDRETGAERSLWPERWAFEDMVPIRHTRSFRLNMLNDPMAADGEFWTIDDIGRGEAPAYTHHLLSIDPAVTTKEKSDYTAIALLSYYPPERLVVVRDAWNLKVAPGEPLRARVSAIREQYPEIRHVLVEANQAGEAWKQILKDLPVRVRTVHQREAKEVRAARLLNHYQAGRVRHAKPLPELEGQLVSFPKGAHDDLVDAVGQGAEVFLSRKKRSGVQTKSYI